MVEDGSWALRAILSGACGRAESLGAPELQQHLHHDLADHVLLAGPQPPLRPLLAHAVHYRPHPLVAQGAHVHGQVAGEGVEEVTQTSELAPGDPPHGQRLEALERGVSPDILKGRPDVGLVRVEGGEDRGQAPGGGEGDGVLQRNPPVPTVRLHRCELAVVAPALHGRGMHVQQGRRLRRRQGELRVVRFQRCLANASWGTQTSQTTASAVHTHIKERLWSQNASI